MPRGLTAPVKAELNQTTLTLPVYSVRITRATGDVLRWAEKTISFDDGTGTKEYTARLMAIDGLNVGTDEAGAIAITVANADGIVTTLDRVRSFNQAKCEILAYLPGINTYEPVWVGWCDEVAEQNARQATIPAYPAMATPLVQVPKRALGLPCTNEFANIANWVSAKDFEGSECPYQRTATIGFIGSLDAAITAVQTSFVAVIGSGYSVAGMIYKVRDEIRVNSERMLITAAGAMTGDWKQTLTVTRGYRSTAAAAHGIADTIFFAGCGYSVADCLRRGMYGNNPLDTYGAAKKRNYFAGFPMVIGFTTSTVHELRTQRTNTKRLNFSGNDSAYGRVLPMVYGKVRIADPILLIAKSDNSGNFLDTFWLVAEGLLATNATDDAQTTPGNAYVKTAGVENIFVNGVSRHDPAPNMGIEVANGEQDRSEPSAAFFPAGAGQIDDFINNNLGFWGTARVAFRINTKGHPSVDVQSQSISGAFEVAYGRVVRVYSDPGTFTRKATTNPAWVLMDVIASKRAGGGMDYAKLNIQSFIDVAAYCDATVASTFDASTPKRWTFNGILDQRKSFSEWMHLIGLQMYCLPPFLDKDGKFKIRALKAETLTGIPIFSSKVASATARNIVWNGDHSSVVKSRRPTTEIPNEIRVNFIEKEKYSKISAIVSSREVQSDFGTKSGDQSRRVLMKSIDLPGTSTLDEAARIGTLLLRAGEFGQGGLSNNLKVTFRAFYRDAEDLEIGDVIEVEDDLLDPALNERYFRVVHISVQPIPVEDGGFVFAREIEAVLHDNIIYDDSALTVSKFDRIDSPGSNDAEPPPVTSLGITEVGAFDNDGNPISTLTITYTEPVPLANYRSLLIYKSNDDGANPVGDWRLVGELLESGETIQVENTGNFQHFAAVSRAASGHPGSIDSLKADGTFKYPRLRILVDGVVEDTDIIPAPVNVLSETVAGGKNITGLEALIGFDLPTTQIDSYTGFGIWVNDTATFPDPDVDAANSAYAVTGTAGTGSIVNGSNILTDTTKSWPNLAGRYVMIFSNKRPTSGAWEYEGGIELCLILSNTATQLTLDRKMRYTYANIQYFVQASGGQHSWDKMKWVSGAIMDGRIVNPSVNDNKRRRTYRIPVSSTFYFWINLHNKFGYGKLYGPSSLIQVPGLSSAELQNEIISTAKLVNGAVTEVKVATSAITTTKIADDSITTPKLVALAVTAAKIAALTITADKIAAGTITADKINVADLFAQVITATGSITGETIKTATSGQRIEIDSVNGLRAIDAAGNVFCQIPVSTFTSLIATIIRPLSTAAAAGVILMNGDETASMVLRNTSLTGTLSNGHSFKFDNASSATLTNLYVMKNGALTQVGIRATGELFV